ncbi:MAG: hypothetical protein LV480_11310 [Methylacidiphilales bacterium]|nr:hypothetical protein [Candidatus Methylacidiphilales bacterium]
MTTMPTQPNFEAEIIDALKKSEGYVTVPHLAQVTGSSPQAVEGFIASHPRQVRRSLIETDDGQPLFTLNTPLSGIADAWSAFRHLNAKKF